VFPLSAYAALSEEHVFRRAGPFNLNDQFLNVCKLRKGELVVILVARRPYGISCDVCRME
jgi:hypothetical protein